MKEKISIFHFTESTNQPGIKTHLLTFLDLAITMKAGVFAMGRWGTEKQRQTRTRPIGMAQNLEQQRKVTLKDKVYPISSAI